jgi:hypothetical protein
MGSNVTVKAATETTIAVGPFILIVPKSAASTGLFARAIGQTAVAQYVVSNARDI